MFFLPALLFDDVVAEEVAELVVRDHNVDDVDDAGARVAGEGARAGREAGGSWSAAAAASTSSPITGGGGDGGDLRGEFGTSALRDVWWEESSPSIFDGFPSACQRKSP